MLVAIHWLHLLRSDISVPTNCTYVQQTCGPARPGPVLSGQVHQACQIRQLHWPPYWRFGADQLLYQMTVKALRASWHCVISGLPLTPCPPSLNTHNLLLSLVSLRHILYAQLDRFETAVEMDDASNYHDVCIKVTSRLIHSVIWTHRLQSG